MSGRNAWTFLAAVAIGSAGGVLFAWARLPLPWLLGAMIATTIAALLGIQMRVPGPWRNAMLAVLGVMLGSNFSPEAASHLVEWLGTLAGLAGYVVLAGGATYYFLRRIGGYDAVTAFFAGMPGGLNEMVVVGSAMGGDERAISLIHAIRILLVVTIVVAWYRLVEGYSGVTGPAMRRLVDIAAVDLLLLAASGVIGVVGARVLRLPAPFMFGPLLASAAVHLAEWTASEPPVEVSAIAQIMIGSALGCRFSGVPPAAVVSNFWKGAGAAVLLLVSAVFAVAILNFLTGMPAEVVLLAFAPGGIAEMNLVALGLGIDVAFVAVHHLARVVIVFAFAPIFFRIVLRDKEAKAMTAVRPEDDHMKAVDRETM